MRTLIVVLTALVVIGFSAAAQAQATRTWVSGVGDDANPCSRTAPCKTFAGAISKTAAGGEIDAIDPGGFGSLTITKSITLDGGGTLASILAAGANGITINAGVNDRIYLRNLTINGGNTGFTGLRILQAASVTLDNVQIFNFNASAASRAISITNTSNEIKVNIWNSTLRHTAGVILESIPSGTGKVSLSINNVHVSDGAQSAIDLDNNTNAVISRSTIANNTLAGIFVETATCALNIYDSVISRNGTGLLVGTGGGGLVRLYGSQVTNNTTDGIVIGVGGVVESHQNNAIRGNGGAQAVSLNVGQQ